MARPKNKSELEELSSKNYDKLTALLKNYPTEQLDKEFPKQYMNRNIRDVLGHLYHWHLIFLEWYSVGMKGDKPEMPAKGYTWKMTPELNRAIQKQYSNTDLDDIRKRLNGSHMKIQNIINKQTDEELFEKKKYAWTGSTSLGQYLVSATSSHYDWAIKLIKKCING
ncbi:MAG: ClbS/DfsB family four-helix bundle protein [Capnocytophaga sp.]|nr:ClbS/DfsB family four-helix bundle protein [Capnocytophaga sp.]